MTTQGERLDADGSTAAPFTQPAPALTAIANPDSSYTTMPGTNAQLVHHSVLRSAVRPALSWLAILLPVYVIPLTLVRLPVVVILIVAIALTAWIYFGTYFKLRKMLRSMIDNAMPAPTQALRLGSDALDIADRTSHSRIANDRITSVTTDREVVVVRFDGLGLAMPRDLWPDPMVARLRDLIDPKRAPSPDDPPPQPPLPIPPHPDATVVAGPETAVRLAVAQRIEPWRTAGALIAAVGLAVIAIESAFLGGQLYGALGVMFPLVIGTLIGVGWWYRIQHPPAKVLRHHQCAAFAGATLSAWFGTDAVLLATPVWVIRVPYAMIGKITVRSDIAALVYGQVPIVLPSGLFPAHLVTGLREHGVTVVTR
ncbi:hypothetical protein [Nocardia sp. MW-W600-9]